MADPTEYDQELAEIWQGDLLGRRSEAETLQSFIEHEATTFMSEGRAQSLVLAIDAHYGEGKSWFLERLAQQLAISHPVARIDAWADDASDEPLTAFMAAIDDALAPYLTTSKKLGDRLAEAKVAALPVMGRLFKGAMIKGLTKIAGDGADEALGDVFDTAMEGARQQNATVEAGVAAKAVEGALDDLGREIDSLLDRRGAAMLAEYRQRRRSRDGFRQNMGELISCIDQADVSGKSPLIVIIDELDRCRPNYAIRILEEIKHFFQVPGVVFILAVHRSQLVASIEAVYGTKFESDQYLRRFFDRRWLLRKLSTSEIVQSQLASWGEIAKRLGDQIVHLDGADVTLSAGEIISHVFNAHSLTARETLAVMDALRLFTQNWLVEIPIFTLLISQMAINQVRMQPISDMEKLPIHDFSLKSMVPVNSNSHKPAEVSVGQALKYVMAGIKRPIIELLHDEYRRDPAYNFALDFFRRELNYRREKGLPIEKNEPSLCCTYADRLERFEGLVERLKPS